METVLIQVKSLLKPSEAAVLFQVPVGTIYTWYQLGQIDCIKIGAGCLRVYTKSISEFLWSRRSQER